MADDFRDYMLSFLFWKYLSDNYIKAAKKELGSDYPDDTPKDIMKKVGAATCLQIWYNENKDDIPEDEAPHLEYAIEMFRMLLDKIDRQEEENRNKLISDQEDAHE